MSRRLMLILAVAALAGTAAFALYFRAATTTARELAEAPDAEMGWLREEFHLSDAQFAKINALHTAYKPKCMELCAQIARTSAELERTMAEQSRMTPEIEAALHGCAETEKECRAAMLAHVYSVSAEMNSEDGARYLEMMKARVLQPGTSHAAMVDHFWSK